jgi:hypothetical protein
MSRRAALLPMLAAGLLLGGCSDGGPTDLSRPDSPQAVSAARASTLVPITWKYHMMAAPGDVLICDNSDGSPPFLAFPVNWVTEGTITHMGRVDSNASSASFSSCTLNIVDGIPVTGVGYGSVEIVGANGDAITFTGALTLDFAAYDAVGEWTITGGTGRFAGASGWLHTYEVPAADGNGSVGSGTGMITPPGMLGH